MSLPRLSPMLATRWAGAFDDPAWWFEVKWDGYRVLVEWDRRLRLRSRRGNDLTDSFPELGGMSFDRPTVADGEVVVFDDDGRPSFARLQQRNGLAGRAAVERSRAHPATLVLFDLLHHGGPLVGLGLEDRTDRLRQLDLGDAVMSVPVAGEGTALFDAIVARDLEGMVAKRSGSVYQAGRRSPDWRKIANRKTVEAVVGGFLPGEGSRGATFGSLLVGLWDGDSLHFAGAVGSGFDEEGLRALGTVMRGARRASPPFGDPSPIPRNAVWVEPTLVVRVEYKEWTPDRRLRAPVFKGLGETPIAEVTWSSESA